jgi:hypothetical protein
MPLDAPIGDTNTRQPLTERVFALVLQSSPFRDTYTGTPETGR